MSNPTPTHASIISAAISQTVSGVRVALPGRVESYDPSTQRATVQPLIMDGHIDEDDERQAERLPVVSDVPVMFPGSGAYRVTWPVTIGDTVLLVFSSSSLDLWLARGGEVDPQDDRRHNISDAVAILGLFDFAHVPTTAPPTGMVLHASALQLGGPTAVQPVIRGTSFMSAFAALMGSIAGAVGTSGTPAGATTSAATIVAAYATFVTAATGFLSTSVTLK